VSAAAIRVTREKSRPRDKRPYSVHVDDGVVGEVRRGEKTDLVVPPGDHVVWVSADFEPGWQWSVSVADGEVVQLSCRSRKQGTNWDIDLFLADPTDRRARVRPSGDRGPQDMAVKHRAVIRDGTVVAVWAHRSGYLRSLDLGASSGGGDEIVVVIVYCILVLPVLALVRVVRHRLVFKRGWSVGVVRDRRFLWPKKVRLERFPDEIRARARAAELWVEVESWDRPRSAGS